MLEIRHSFDKYLENSEYIDWQTALVYQKARELQSPTGEMETAKNIFYFVRDEISHSWDIRDSRLTLSASDVLREGVGVCWGQANLLAALLRANGIAAGICYQRLTFTNTLERGYVIHGINAVYLSTLQRWIRVDARKSSSAFTLDDSGLAFSTRQEYGEIDYKQVHCAPLDFTMESLKAEGDPLKPYRRRLLAPRGAKALVVVDVQEDYMKKYAPRLYQTINRFIAQAEEKREHIIYVKNIKNLSGGPEISEFLQALDIVSPHIFFKDKASAFSNPDFKDFLNQSGVTDLEIVGVDGCGCVASTALDGCKQGFSVTLPCPAIGIANQERFVNIKTKLKKNGVKVLP